MSLLSMSTWDQAENPELQFQVEWFMPNPRAFLIPSPCKTLKRNLDLLVSLHTEVQRAKS